MNRSSVFVKVGRILQKYYNYFSFLDLPFELKKKKDKLIICVVAPPRSGSTLTYQVISNSIKNSTSLNNISNLLYATPLLSNKISNLICKNYRCSFKSSHGFVGGLCGEAEGLKFWEYWMNQTLRENPQMINKSKLKKLKNKFDKLDQKIIVTGYLGHVFSVKELEEVFDNIIFVHLKRDLLSNALSLLLLQKGNSRSSMPVELLNNNTYDKYSEVLMQIKLIHQKIEKASKDNIVILNYEELCDNPMKQIQKIKEKAFEKGFSLDLDMSNIPSNFKKSIATKDKNEDAKIFFNLIKKMDINI